MRSNWLGADQPFINCEVGQQYGYVVSRAMSHKTSDSHPALKPLPRTILINSDWSAKLANNVRPSKLHAFEDLKVKIWLMIVLHLTASNYSRAR